MNGNNNDNDNYDNNDYQDRNSNNVTKTKLPQLQSSQPPLKPPRVLSMQFVKCLSGLVVCQECGTDPISFLGSSRNSNNNNNNSNSTETFLQTYDNNNNNNNNNNSSEWNNLQTLQRSSSSSSAPSSISPLVLAPMMNTFNNYNNNNDGNNNDNNNYLSSPHLTATNISTTFPTPTPNQPSTTTTTTTTTNPNTSSIEMIMGEYMALCQFYKVPYNAGVLSTLRFSLPCLRVTGSFHDLDMLALTELLFRHANGSLRYIQRLDFSIASKEGKRYKSYKLGFTSHGALALAKVIQMPTLYLQQVWLPRHRIGPYGASAIFLACRDNPTIQSLNMRRCRIGERGAFAFCEIFSSIIDNTTTPLPPKTNKIGLVDVDLSSNGIGHRGTVAIQQLLERYNNDIMNMNSNNNNNSNNNGNNNFNHNYDDGDDDDDNPFTTTATTATAGTSQQLIFVNLEGNLVFPEIMNGITHGLGVILSVVGGYLLLKRVQHLSYVHWISCSIYILSLLVLYMSSTLYHSFFALQNTKYIFQVFDKCAIYILIAGSYTPFLQILLQDQPIWSVGLLGFLWICGFLGIGVEAFYPTWHYRSTFSLAMYLGMGWAALICLSNLKERMTTECIQLLILGGVGYTVGVPFFVRNNNLDHAIWHLFVMTGSILHWLAIYIYVAPLPLPTTTTTTTTMAENMTMVTDTISTEL